MKKKQEPQKTFQPWENLQRAYNIALISDMKICPISADPIHADFQRCVEKSNLLNLFTNQFNGSLIVELVKPQIEPFGGFPDTKINWQPGIDAAKNPLPTDHESNTHEILVRTAQDRAHLSLSDIEDVYKISPYIAKLDGSPKIKLQHVAEAIMFKAMIDRDSFYYVLSEPDHIFISGAKIPLSCLHPENKPGFLEAIKNYK